MMTFNLGWIAEVIIKSDVRRAKFLRAKFLRSILGSCLGYWRLLLLGLMAISLGGCSFFSSSFMVPGGVTEVEERNMLFMVIGVMMMVLIPVYIMTTVFAWRYRKSAKAKDYDPNWDFSAVLGVFIWGVPISIIIFLGYNSVKYTYALDPYKHVAASGKLIRVQAIALDWRWLFIYPDEGIATIDELAFPTNSPVELENTSATTMNAIMVQGLVGQIYVMAGMTSKLNFAASSEGKFVGRNMQFSGDGFSKQSFAAIALPGEGYQKWVANAKKSALTLDSATFVQLRSKREVQSGVAYYKLGDSQIYDDLIRSYQAGPMAKMRDEAALCTVGPNNKISLADTSPRINVKSQGE